MLFENLSVLHIIYDMIVVRDYIASINFISKLSLCQSSIINIFFKVCE